MPVQGESNSLLHVDWTIKFGLIQGRDSSQQHARAGWDSSQQHAHTGGIKLSLMCELYYLRVGLSQLRSSNSSQQHARTGGVKPSPTCELDYQVRTNSGEGQLTAACPHKKGIRIGLSRVRTKSAEVIGLHLDSSQQHAHTCKLNLSGAD